MRFHHFETALIALSILLIALAFTATKAHDVHDGHGGHQIYDGDCCHNHDCAPAISSRQEGMDLIIVTDTAKCGSRRR
jgi:hypothetical protein